MAAPDLTESLLRTLYKYQKFILDERSKIILAASSLSVPLFGTKCLFPPFSVPPQRAPTLKTFFPAWLLPEEPLPRELLPGELHCAKFLRRVSPALNWLMFSVDLSRRPAAQSVACQSLPAAKPRL